MVRKAYDYLFHQNHPIAWSFVILVLFGIVMTLNFFLFNVGDDQSTFIIACTGIFLYSIYSAVMLLLAKSMAKAWNQTLFGIVIVAVALTLIGMWMTGKSWAEIGYYTKILKVMVFVSLVFMTIAASMRRIVEYTQKVDR